MSKIDDKKLSGIRLLLNGNYTIERDGTLKVTSSSDAPTGLKATEPYVLTVSLTDDTSVADRWRNKLYIGQYPVLVAHSEKSDYAKVAEGAAYLYNDGTFTEKYTFADLTGKLSDIEVNLGGHTDSITTNTNAINNLDLRVTDLESTLSKLFGKDYKSGTSYYGDTPPTDAAEGQLFFFTSNS